MVLTAISAIVVFGIIVLVHEWGHFVTAKMTGMRVDEFAIGFGPKLFGWTKGETKYSLRIIPLGGFNDIAGMTKEADEDPENEYGPAGERAYYRRPLWCRMVVIVAGAAMNIITPVLLFWGMYVFYGVQVPDTEPVIGQVVEKLPAAEAGLKVGDRILVIDGKEIATWPEISAALKENNDAPHAITIQRDGVEQTLSVATVMKDGRAIVGITGSLKEYNPGVFEAAGMAVQHTWNILKMMLSSLAGMIMGNGSAADISGPVGVLQMTGQAAQMGIIPLLNFSALLSLNLGIVNLLPVPVLDGGHFVTLCLEGLRGKPLSDKAMKMAQAVGLTLLISLMVYATFNDFTR